jgi:hypothetical protein
MSNELYYHLIQGFRSRITAYVCTVAAVGLLSSVPAQNNEGTKTMSIIGALGLSLAATTNFMSNSENDQALADFRVNTGLQRQRRLFAQGTTDTSEEEKANVDWFDFHTIGNDRDKFPNCIIMGESGSGKTSLAEYLGVVLKANKRYAIHPHAKPTDFAGFDLVMGGGRNYGTPDDEPVTWADIVLRGVRPSIAQVLMALLELMNQRYELYYQGVDDFEEIDVYIDELPSIVSNLGKKFIASIMPQLLMECRKVKIRLWLLVQGSQVKLLGLEGMSDLREGITFIRLGRLAFKHVPKNKALISQLGSCARPCMVDDTPAKLPGYSEMKAAINTFARIRSTSEKQPAQTKVDEAVEIIPTPTPHQPSFVNLVDEAIDDQDYGKVRELVKQSNKDSKVLEHIGRRMITEYAKSISAVIKDGWGMEGKYYETGKNLYYQLGLNLLPKGMARYTDVNIEHELEALRNQ